jgi:hypothetical protein
VRFLYCYPNRLTDALIAAAAETAKVAKYIDVPLQHASAPVLKLMRRGSSGEHFLRLIERIRAAIPEVTLRTSFIVGFPGETEEDFQVLLSFVEAAQFDHLGVFLYSNEETSLSYALPGQVPAAVARRRKQKLMAFQRRISRRKLRQRVRRSFPVLVEGGSEETELLFQGRLESQAPGIDGRVLINDFEGSEPRPGEFRWATITAAGDYDLVARLEARNFVERAVPNTLPPVGDWKGGAKQAAEKPAPRVIPRSPPFLLADDEESRTALKILGARFLAPPWAGRSRAPLGMTAWKRFCAACKAAPFRGSRTISAINATKH